jgi:hypothetical protein
VALERIEIFAFVAFEAQEDISFAYVWNIKQFLSCPGQRVRLRL